VLQRASALTPVPVLAPATIPGFSKIPFTNLARTDASGYEIDFAFTADCEGQNACAIGFVQGNIKPIKELSTQPGVPLILKNGDRGYYYASHCIMYCSPAYITWKHHGYYYAVALKAESAQHIRMMANSTK